MIHPQAEVSGMKRMIVLGVLLVVGGLSMAVAAQ